MKSSPLYTAIQYLHIRSKHRGFNLLELLVTLAIVSILAGISIPSLASLINNSRADTTQSKLIRAISSARTLAITQRNISTLCPDENCSGEWTNGFILFADENNNAVVDGEEIIYERFYNSEKMAVRWAGSGGANYLKFSPTGVARQFGRFHICPKSSKPLNSKAQQRAMVINRQGRLRTYRDRNKDGVVEDKDGREPDCQIN